MLLNSSKLLSSYTQFFSSATNSQSKVWSFFEATVFSLPLSLLLCQSFEKTLQQQAIDFFPPKLKLIKIVISSHFGLTFKIVQWQDCKEPANCRGMVTQLSVLAGILSLLSSSLCSRSLPLLSSLPLPDYPLFASNPLSLPENKAIYKYDSDSTICRESGLHKLPWAVCVWWDLHCVIRQWLGKH